MGAGVMTTDRISSASRLERFSIAGLCLAAAVRVFVFCAAFPFFNNADEQPHFDLVFKYSHGHLPAAALEKFDPEAAKIIVNNGSGEYFNVPLEKFTEKELADSVKFLIGENNRETWSWPVYYMLAGLWCWLGRTIGMADARLLYWVRFLNVPIAAAFVWLSWLFSRKVFRADPQQRIALPLLVAFFPQDIFFAITSDVFSPLVFALAFIMLLEIYMVEKSLQYHLLTGLVVALTFLTKASNVAILPLAALVVLIKLKRAVSENRFKKYLPCLVALAVAAAIPVAFWLGRNYILFGDLVGAAQSTHLRTWTVKPFSERFDHPIFTPSGLFYFLTELTKRFWRGEFIWRNKDMALPVMDLFYCVSSAVFITVSVLGLVLEKARMDRPYRATLLSGLFVIVLSVAFLAFMSMRYDFGECFYPSREMPYFISGRLIAGVILPFLFLYVDGLQRLLSTLRCARFLLVVVAVFVAAITISEIVLTWPVFPSPYNWFHLK